MPDECPHLCPITRGDWTELQRTLARLETLVSVLEEIGQKTERRLVLLEQRAASANRALAVLWTILLAPVTLIAWAAYSLVQRWIK